MTAFSGTSLFEEAWWLDAVAPGTWRELAATGGAEAHARMVLQVVRRHGLVLVRNPPLTPVVGPVLQLSAQKHEGRVAQARALVDGLIEQIPKGHVTRFVCSPGFDDHLPFRWAGYSVGAGCTHRFESLESLDGIWSGFSESCRRAVRKAEKLVRVRTDLPVEVTFDCIAKSFGRQGRGVPFPRDAFLRAINAALDRNSATCLVAQDLHGRVHAAAAVVHDSRCAYYLAGGADPDLRSSGAQSLLLWMAIRGAAETSLAFDFEGSSNREIERFFRGFGPRRVPLLAISRVNPLLRRLGAFGILPGILGV